MASRLLDIANLANKKSRYILGCLSGTSMDGVDAALFELNGSGRNTTFRCIFGKTYSYPKILKKKLAELAYKPESKISEIIPLEWEVGVFFADVINDCKAAARSKGYEIDCVGSHGQTLFHLDGSNGNKGSLQIGEGDLVSTITGLPVVSDFRQKDIALGGTGAPLAPYVDELLFQNNEESRVLLNIGGIANITYLPKRYVYGASIAFDTGPGNTLMDAYCKLHNKGEFDKNGEYARSGKVNDELLSELLNHPYFSRGIPKSTGQESFNLAYLNESLEKTELQKLDFNSVMATLNMLTAKSIANGIKLVCNESDAVIYLNGGGIYNETLLENIRIQTGLVVNSVNELGINPDYKEALIFSVLANEFLAGKGFYSHRAGTDIQFGKLSLP